MIPKRVFWLTVGYGAGLGSSWYAARRVKAAARRYTPEGLGDRVGERVEDLRYAFVEGRAAMRRREMQLRAELDRPGRRGTASGTTARTR
jgi:hypothetical protein